MLKPVESEENSHALEHAMANVAAAMADPSRVKILCALMDGRAWTATELAAVADIAASTTSAHLSRLVNGSLITALSQGRHRYFRLAGQDIAELLERMMGISWRSPSAARISTPVPLRLARTCYDHLAGEVAVDIFDAMVNLAWLTDDGTVLTDKGHQQFAQMGIELNGKNRRKLCCGCLDWSERRFHLGGEAGAAFFSHCERQQWIARTTGFREITITSIGRLAFKKWFGVEQR